MIITKEKYCIATKSFPLMFLYGGTELDTLDDDVLTVSKEYCENELRTYDEPENYQILKVTVSYEI